MRKSQRHARIGGRGGGEGHVKRERKGGGDRGNLGREGEEREGEKS